MKPSSNVLPAVLLVVAVNSAPAATLSAMQWKHRVVMIFAPDAQDQRLQRQVAQVFLLIQAKDDRDLVEVKIVGDMVEGSSESAGVLRKRFGVPVSAFRVLLIGKDGGVKINSAEVEPAHRIAATIDAMPMRQAETQR